LHHSVDVDQGARSDAADRPWADLGALRRALCSGTNAVGKVSDIFDTSLAEHVLEPRCSAGVLLDDLRNLTQDLGLDGSLQDAVPSAELQAALSDALHNVCLQITEADATVKGLVRYFPKIVRAGNRGLSVHLCASDQRRLGPDPTREINVWLTIVDLSVLNPIDVLTGKALTPKSKPIDNRPRYVVKGELAYVALPEEIEHFEERQVRELESEHRRLLADRLTRARSSKGEGTLAPAPAPARALALAQADSAVTRPGDLDPGDEQDAREEAQTLQELQQLRERRHTRGESKKSLGASSTPCSTGWAPTALGV